MSLPWSYTQMIHEGVHICCFHFFRSSYISDKVGITRGESSTRIEPKTVELILWLDDCLSCRFRYSFVLFCLAKSCTINLFKKSLFEDSWTCLSNRERAKHNLNAACRLTRILLIRQSRNFSSKCWLVGCFGGFTTRLDSISVYIEASAREREKEKRCDRQEKNIQTTPPAPTASTVGPCPTIIQISWTLRQDRNQSRCSKWQNLCFPKVRQRFGFVTVERYFWSCTWCWSVRVAKLLALPTVDHRGGFESRWQTRLCLNLTGALLHIVFTITLESSWYD